MSQFFRKASVFAFTLSSFKNCRRSFCTSDVRTSCLASSFASDMGAPVEIAGVGIEPTTGRRMKPLPGHLASPRETLFVAFARGLNREGLVPFGTAASHIRVIIAAERGGVLL